VADLLSQLLSSRLLYRQWRNLNVLCPKRLISPWRIQGTNLIEEYEIFCASLVKTIHKEDPSVNPDASLTNGSMFLEFAYQPSRDEMEFIIVPRLQAVSVAHHPEEITTRALSDAELPKAAVLAKRYKKLKARENRAPKQHRGFSVSPEWVWRDGNLIANYRFSPSTIHLLKVPKSFVELTYKLTLPRLPEATPDNLTISDILGGMQHSDLVAKPLLLSYSAKQDEYNAVIQADYEDTLRKYQTVDLVEYDRLSSERDLAIQRYMFDHGCGEADVPVDAIPPRPKTPRAPEKPLLPLATTPSTFAVWNMNNLLDGGIALSEGVLEEMYDNYFSDTDIARVMAILSESKPPEIRFDELVYEGEFTTAVILGSDDALDWQYSGIRRYIGISGNQHLAGTALGVKLGYERGAKGDDISSLRVG